MKLEIDCLVLARGKSKRLPNKNRLRLEGRSLVQIACFRALALGLFRRIIVSSDCPEILSDAAVFGNRVVLDKRPDELATDETTSEEVLMYLCDQFGSIHCCLCQPTSPCLTLASLRKGAEYFDRFNANYVVISATINESLSRRQFFSLEGGERLESYGASGGFYFFSKKHLTRKLSDNATIGIEVAKSEAYDIDFISDFEAAMKNFELKNIV